MVTDFQQLDVAIVGGGPGGLAAGIVLARAGLHVALYEQRALPRDKACGEGVMPPGVAHLRELGVLQRLGRQERHPFSGVRFQAGAAGADGVSATAHFIPPLTQGMGIRRTRLSAALLAEAATCATLCVHPETAAQVEEREADGVRLRVSRRGESDQQVSARLVVGADGLRSRVRAWANLKADGRRWQRWGARRHFRLRPWSDCVEVIWSRDGVEAYITPTAPDEIQVAFLWDKERYTALRGGKDLFPSLLAGFPTLAERLHRAPQLDETAAVGPLEVRTRGVTADGVLLLGDAGGYLDALTGEGISLALGQALALRETVVPLLQQSEGPLAREQLAAYAAAHAEIVRPYYTFTALMLQLSRFGLLWESVVAALDARPDIFQRLLAASMGLGEPPGVGDWSALLGHGTAAFVRRRLAGTGQKK